MFQMRLSVNI